MTKSTMKYLTLAGIALAGAASYLPGQTYTLLSDDFSSGLRDVQNPPHQSAWFANGPSGHLTVDGSAGGSLSLNQINQGNHSTGAITYFTDSGVIDLQPNDFISVGFNFSVNGPIDNDERLALGIFNSGGVRVEADGEGVADGDSPGNRWMRNPKFDEYSGYIAKLNLAQDPSDPDDVGARLRRRDGTGDRLFGNDHNTALGSPNPSELLDLLLVDGETYRMELTLQRSSGGGNNSFTITVSEGSLATPLSLTVGDPSVIETGFDTFAIHTSRFGSEAAFDDSFVFQNFEITSSVPEPATYSLFLGVGVLLAGLYFRRRSHRRLADGN